MTQKNITPIELLEPFWERQKGESTEWFRRFCKFRNQLGPRSLLAAHRRELEESGKGRANLRRVPSSWDEARVKYCWDARAEAWDMHRQQQEDLEWDGRWSELRERCWELSELLFEKSKSMALMPTVETSIQGVNGGQTVIKPCDWSGFRTACEVARTAAELGRQAIGDINSAATLLTSQGFKIVDPIAEMQAASQETPENSLERLGLSFPDPQKQGSPDLPDSPNSATPDKF
jgi:hypothetical protein